MLKKKDVVYELRGGPMNGHLTTVYTSYLNEDGLKVPTLKGDDIKRSGKGGLYYLRQGGYYEWNSR